MNTASGVSVRIVGKSGKFTVHNAKLGENDTSKVIVEMDALREVDSKGNAVGEAQATKHSIQSFASKDFGFSEVEAAKLGSSSNVNASKISFTAPVSSIGAFKVDTFIITSAGVVGPKGESWQAKVGDVKFNIELSRWEFCGCQKDQTNEVGEYLDIDIKIKGKNQFPLAAAGGKGSYMLGGGVNLQMTSKVMIDGVQKEMPAGYPKVKGQVFTLRIPKFTTSALYDPLLSTGSSETLGLVADHAIGFGCSPLLLFILTILFLVLQ